MVWRDLIGDVIQFGVCLSSCIRWVFLFLLNKNQWAQLLPRQTMGLFTEFWRLAEVISLVCTHGEVKGEARHASRRLYGCHSASFNSLFIWVGGLASYVHTHDLIEAAHVRWVRRHRDKGLTYTLAEISKWSLSVCRVHINPGWKWRRTRWR